MVLQSENKKIFIVRLKCIALYFFITFTRCSMYCVLCILIKTDGQGFGLDIKLLK